MARGSEMQEGKGRPGPPARHWGEVAEMLVAMVLVATMPFLALWLAGLVR